MCIGGLYAERTAAAGERGSEVMAGKAKKRTGSFTLIVIAVLLILVSAELLHMRDRIAEAAAEQATLETQLAAQKQENAALEGALDKSEDLEYLQELARSELGYVTPGEKDFYDIASK